MLRWKSILIAAVVFMLVAGPVGAWGAPGPSSTSAQIAATPAVPAQAGCYVEGAAAQPWQTAACVTAPQVPIQPATGAPAQQAGNGNDEVANSPTTVVGRTIGSFPAITGLTSESGDASCLYSSGSSCYSLQLNSQFFAGVSTIYTGSKSGYANSWEQFVYSNDCVGSPPTGGCVFIQYWLIGYGTAYGACPTTKPPGGSAWFAFSSNCYANSPAVATPRTLATNLGKLSLAGYANYLGSGNDVSMLCISGGSCYSMTITDGVINLYLNWHQSEFNVIGDASGSQANFNPGTTITVSDGLTDQSGNPIASTCANAGTTGETNNLYLQPCSGGSSGISFVECLGTNPNAPSTCASTSGVPEFPSGAGQLMIVAIGMILALVVRRRRAPRTDPSLQIIA